MSTRLTDLQGERGSSVCALFVVYLVSIGTVCAIRPDVCSIVELVAFTLKITTDLATVGITAVMI